MLIGSPPCSAFSPLQNLSKHKRSEKDIEDQMREGRAHIRFMMKLYAEQARNARYFLHEHPATATSWALDEVKVISEMPGVYKVLCHMCAFGMKATDEQGEGPVKKPTLFMTNSGEVAKLLDRKCDNIGKKQ